MLANSIIVVDAVFVVPSIHIRVCHTDNISAEPQRTIRGLTIEES